MRERKKVKKNRMGNLNRKQIVNSRFEFKHNCDYS